MTQYFKGSSSSCSVHFWRSSKSLCVSELELGQAARVQTCEGFPTVGPVLASPGLLLGQEPGDGSEISGSPTEGSLLVPQNVRGQVRTVLGWWNQGCREPRGVGNAKTAELEGSRCEEVNVGT